MSPLSEPVQWSELTPLQFQRRRALNPIVYLPVGLCEPHGPETPLGLDLIKVEQLCRTTAAAHGGIVAPSLGFHVHECGPSARWLFEEVGEVEPHLTSVAPLAFAHIVVSQLRALANAGFAAAVVVSGHSGAHAADFNALVAAFAKRFRFPCRYVTDFELARPNYVPDHAGRYEISLLWHLRPDLVYQAPPPFGSNTSPSMRLALGVDAYLADPDWGRQVFEHLVAQLAKAAETLAHEGTAEARRLGMQETEAFWFKCAAGFRAWSCVEPRHNQVPVPARSRWKSEEHFRLH